MSEGKSERIKESWKRSLWTPGRSVIVGGAAAFVVFMLMLGSASATGGNYGHFTSDPPMGEYALASIPGVTSLAVSPTELFATTSTNCTQVLSVSPSGVVSLYASLPIPVSKCGEGSIALAPACFGNAASPAGNWGNWGNGQGNKQGDNQGYCHYYSGNKGNWGSGNNNYKGIQYDNQGVNGNNQNQGQCGCEGQKTSQDTLWDVQEGQLFEISDHGSKVTLFATFTKTGNDMGLTYDSVGAFGHDLIVTGSSGRVWTVNQTGVVTLVSDLKVHIEGPAVAPWNFGAYGGDVLVASQTKDTVYAVEPNGAFVPFTSWKSAESVAFPSNCGCGFGTEPAVFFVANVTSGTIEAFPASYFTTLHGLGFVDGETNGGIGSFTSTGATTTIATHTKHLEQIAFVQCFGHDGCCGNGGYNYGGNQNW
jgi:hypothetical protein